MPPTSNSTPAINGPAWATILAAAIGCLSFGILVDLAEASPRISGLLNFYNPVGDLSGKSILAVVIWLAAWLLLNARWKTKRITAPAKIVALTFILVLLALIAVFPPFFTLLGG
jgi:hypothetical protein